MPESSIPNKTIVHSTTYGLNPTPATITLPKVPNRFESAANRGNYCIVMFGYLGALIWITVQSWIKFSFPEKAKENLKKSPTCFDAIE